VGRYVIIKVMICTIGIYDWSGAFPSTP